MNGSWMTGTIPCAEGSDLAAFGADCSGCMTVKTYENALHCRLDPPKMQGARKEFETDFHNKSCDL